MEKLVEILRATTFCFRKGDVVTEKTVNGLHVVTIDAFPGREDIPVDLEVHDCYFLDVGVDVAEAEKRRAEFLEILDNWPGGLDGGPSYITVGADIGDQTMAFQMFALGEALKLWEIVTPIKLRFEPGPAADLAAGSGYIMITGYRPAKEAAINIETVS
jgi:hypothetical protein